MSRQYKNIVYTKQLSREDCKTCLVEIIDILIANKVLEIEMLFGFSWGNDYKDWTPFIVSTTDIMVELNKAEESGARSFFMKTPFFACRPWTAKYFFATNMTSIWNLIDLT